jgi:hypothetical protein
VVKVILDGAQQAGLSDTQAAHMAAVIVYSAVYVYQPSLLPLLKAWADDNSGSYSPVVSEGQYVDYHVSTQS